MGERQQWGHPLRVEPPAAQVLWPINMDEEIFYGVGLHWSEEINQALKAISKVYPSR